MLRKKGADTTWVEVELLFKTGGGAWKVRAGTGKDAFVPVVAIVDSEDDLAPGVHTKIEIATSLAEGKGLV